MSRIHLLSAALAAALVAGPPGPSAQEFEHDTGQPIEITSDTLEVVQADRVATFSGNVDAVQGDLVLSADELKVHYRGGGEDAPATAAAGSTGTIRRIEAFGNVVLTSPRETAQGDVGVYDVAGQLVTLDGAVVLTRDENVIRGDRLELDLETGVSRVVATRTAAEGAPPEERVRAVFTPGAEDQETPRDARPEEGAARGGGGGGGGGAPADPPAGAGERGASVPTGKPGPDEANGG